MVLPEEEEESSKGIKVRARLIPQTVFVLK
jgi:hypothetical protein